MGEYWLHTGEYWLHTGVWVNTDYTHMNTDCTQRHGRILTAHRCMGEYWLHTCEYWLHIGAWVNTDYTQVYGWILTTHRCTGEYWLHTDVWVNTDCTQVNIDCLALFWWLWLIVLLCTSSVSFFPHDIAGFVAQRKLIRQKRIVLCSCPALRLQSHLWSAATSLLSMDLFRNSVWETYIFVMV